MSFSLLPKQDHFYTDISALAEHANFCAGLLKKYVATTETEAQKKVGAEIKACRAKSKEIMKGLTNSLARSFVTPFDRDDIQCFSRNLYRIPKMIERVLQRMELHGLTSDREDFIRQVNLIVDEAAAMQEIVSELLAKKNTKLIEEKVSHLHALEQKGDDVLEELLVGLFNTPRDIKDLILRKDIYDMLEKVIDLYRNAAAVTLQIVLKYS